MTKYIIWGSLMLISQNYFMSFIQELMQTATLIVETFATFAMVGGNSTGRLTLDQHRVMAQAPAMTQVDLVQKKFLYLLLKIKDFHQNLIVHLDHLKNS